MTFRIQIRQRFADDLLPLHPEYRVVLGIGRWRVPLSAWYTYPGDDWTNEHT